jgi:hypothetical protein
VFVEFSANAADLHRSCVRLATKLAQISEDVNESLHFDIKSKRLRSTVEGASANLQAEVQRSGAASVPFTVHAGVLHMLRYFGKHAVEIAFSPGKMHVDTTVFHNRSILLSGHAPRSYKDRL